MNNIDKCIRPLCTDAKDPERATMLSIITAKSCARIYIEDIEYIEQVGRKLELATSDLKYSVYDNISTLLPYFTNKGFYRSMKGLLINFEQVRNIEEDSVFFESGNSLTMGRNNICKTRNAFRKYLQQYPSYFISESKLKVAEGNSEDLKF